MGQYVVIKKEEGVILGYPNRRIVISFLLEAINDKKAWKVLFRMPEKREGEGDVTLLYDNDNENGTRFLTALIFCHILCSKNNYILEDLVESRLDFSIAVLLFNFFENSR